MRLVKHGIPKSVTFILIGLSFISPFQKIAAKDLLFSEQAEIAIKLFGPWREISRDRKKDKRYPVQLTYRDKAGQSKTIKVEVEARGYSRRLKVCKFPPLKVYFKKSELKGSLFGGNKSLKLVTYCNKQDKYSQYIAKEFLAYKIYNLISDLSYRVRPLQIEYIDSKSKYNVPINFGFFIEDIDKVAKRNNMSKLKGNLVRIADLDPVETTRLSLFQLLIGNLDWAVINSSADQRCCHNTRIIGQQENKPPKFAIPYDFDSTGLVDTNYAAPPEGLNIGNIRTRLYRGFCRYNSTLPSVFDEFRQQQDNIYNLVRKDPRLTEKIRRKALDYLEGFFMILSKPTSIKLQITDRCRG